MSRVLIETKASTFISPLQQPNFTFHLPPPPLSSSQSSGFNLNNKVNSIVLLIIIILSIIFFISGLLHLLVRLLLRPPNRDPNEMENLTSLQGQLQQLFHLHDSGVDQSFIDTLPIFNYKAIIGVKDPFDCAVCLCEFELEDELRLLPKCSHAFHMNCIDTWLLSHSTCPICRANLLSDCFSQNGNLSPMICVLESRSESSRDVFSDREVTRVNSHLSDDFGQKCSEIQVKRDENEKEIVGLVEKVVSIKLGKFRSVDSGFDGRNSESNVDERRCFSMGSFAYVTDENLSLQVPVRTPMIKKQFIKKPSLYPGLRLSMSECGCDSRRESNGSEQFKVLEVQSSDHNVGRRKRESFSVSKIWLRGKGDKPNEAKMGSSRRALSFRLPINRNVVDDKASDESNPKNGEDDGWRAISEINISRWENGGSELGFGEEVQSSNSLDSQENLPSFGRRTLLWLMGRQNKVDHDSSFSSNV
ncbi:hypothetical protein BUALT_Bualt16G0097600 [Buddleja alternifolia]|uniref:RING-type E3 ubiquitin transferase n=1 Tax=Buddleja alternifolia TaxID=168488 RepID=A0AAV6WL15_9LAMI|nr:hypothetical protein BUALT_Bualt16G0097600 [Buddleja alternifolia]